jgi:hypothetical protein
LSARGARARGEDFKVFVVDLNNVAHEQEVKVGAKSATSAEIVDGLKGGERIVTYGAYGVEDSAKVVPAKDSANAVPLKDSEKVEKTAPRKAKP